MPYKSHIRSSLTNALIECLILFPVWPLRIFLKDMGLLWVHIVREVSGRIHQKADLETKLTWRRVIVSVRRNNPCKGVRKAPWDRRSRAVLAVKTTASASQVGTSRAQRTWYLTWVWQFYTLTWARYSVWVALMQGEAPFPNGAMLGTASCQKFWQLQASVLKRTGQRSTTASTRASNPIMSGKTSHVFI